MTETIEIRELRTIEELRACVELQRHTWGAECTEIVPLSLLRTLPRTGGLVAGAFEGDALVGTVIGIGGFSRGRPLHWSDILAVRTDRRDRRIGERLKRFQRDRQLALGVRHVLWTFDPLEARNAYLNLARLGAVCGEYLRDHYGDTDSPLHAGLGTDRLLADWPIASRRVRRRLAGASAAEDRRRAERSSRLPALVSSRTRTRWPEPLAHDAEGRTLRLAVPAAIQRLKADDAGLAREWRAVTRAAFESAFERGFRAVDFVRGGDVGNYVLRRRPDQEAVR